MTGFTSDVKYNCSQEHLIYLFIYRFVQCTGERTIGHVVPYLVHPPTFLCCQNENLHLLAHLQLVIHVVQNRHSGEQGMH